MTSSVNAYENQRELYENIQKVGINIKKDGWDRKNLDYFKRRMQMLEQLWGEFQFNHDRLSTEVSAGHAYFTSDLYNAALKSYKEVKELILQQNQELSTHKSPTGGRAVQTTPFESTSGQASTSSKKLQEQQESEDEEENSNAPENNNRDQSPPRQQQSPNKRDTGSNSKLDDLFRKQSANFKAFMRAVTNIHVDFITEKWEFQDALQTLQTRWAAIDSLQWEIEYELNGDINTVYQERLSRFENQYIDLKKALNTKMWSGAYREKTTPKLEIPVFYGKFGQWIPFKDLFTEAIHNNTSLSNAQKMQSLKSKVQGEAERLIQHLQISSDNYLVCWEILNNRYNNKKLIFTAHINMIFNLPTMQQQSLALIKKIHDVTIECLHAIKNLGVDVGTWDPLLVHILTQKLDAETYSDYIESLKNSRELPVLKEFLNYLEAKFTSMESSQRSYQKTTSATNQSQEASHHKKHSYHNNKNQAASNNKVTKSYHATTFICPLCNDEHGLYFCAKFLEMSNDEKLITINKLQVCVNCLYSHKGKKCTSNNRCRKCKAKHNTLMHEAASKNIEQNQPNSSSNASQKNKEASEILLATAMVKVEGADGTQYNMRALIDQGSQTSLITERAAQRLGIKRQKCKGVVFGIGEKESNCKGMMTISCSSVFSDFTFRKSVYIMTNLIKNLPNKTFTKPSWPQIQNINLADPEFNSSRPVDLLFGADVYSQIMLGGMIKGDDVTQPIAQQTHLGWLLCGHVKTTKLHCNVVLNNLEDMKQFWDSEDIKDRADFSVEDQKCTEYYTKTTQRLENGRYEVRLPMINNWECKLGSSKQMAIAQFKTLERRLEKQQHLAKAYKEFIAEYVDMVTLLPIAELIAINIQKDSYLPMTGTDLHQCLHYDSTTLLCPMRSPIYHMQSDESLCKKGADTSGCKTKHESCQNTWLELNSINSYLYFCCDVCKTRIICGNQVSTALLNTAGVMTLGSDCTINSETFTVHSQRQLKDIIHAQVDELTLEIPPINRIINLSVPVLKYEPGDETVMDQNSLLLELGEQIEQLKAAAAEDIMSEQATYHDVHQYVAIYVLATAAAAASAAYGYLRLRKYCTSHEKPEAPPVPNPAPRRRSTASIVDNTAVFDVTDDNSAVHLSSARTLNKASSPIARCDSIVEDLN